MEYNLMIGGIGFHIVSQFEIMAEESFAPFLSRNLEKWDVDIELSQDFRIASKPMEEKIGEDLLLEYYREKGSLLCLAKGGWKGNLSITLCDSCFSHLICYMNNEDFIQTKSLGNILRLLPMRMLLQHYGIMFFHASQIALGDTGIMFTAPSGTGKTTQARLWHDNRKAQIICNDRTLVRGGYTYGYPYDGSEPVCSEKIHKLGALVLLKQDKQNSVQRLKLGAAVARLLPQIVIDTWDSEARLCATEQLLELVRDYPIYLLNCTPDTDAVECLEQRLIEDGVIK